MTMDEINKKYAELKCTKLCIERAMEKIRRYKQHRELSLL